MNYDDATKELLTNLLSEKIGEKYLAKEIIQMKMQLEDDEIIKYCTERFEINLKNGKKETGYFDNLAKEVSRYPNLETGFIERHMEFIHWDTLIMNQEIPEWFILKHKNIIPTWGFILEFKDLSEAALDELEDIFENGCTCGSFYCCNNCQEEAEKFLMMDEYDAYYYGMTEEEIEEDNVRNVLW